MLITVFFALNGMAQEQEKNQPPANAPNSQNNPPLADNRGATLTIPAGTTVALVLTQPVQTRYLHRGDDVYAQITSPVNSGNQVAIPPGTFVDGKLDKLERKGGRGELRLQSMSITFPDGYVAAISGPATLETGEGYALKDPGQGRFIAAFAMPAGGAGIGALIGHSVGSSTSTVTSTLPPGCTGPPPGCLTSSLTAPNAGKNTAIGAVIGGAIGGVAALTVLGTSHHYFLDVGSPVEMTLRQPVTLQQDEVAKAVQQSEQHPVAEQPIVGRPVPPPDWSSSRGTCFTPGAPGTPPTVIPGVPGPDGIPGPPTVIPGTPPTPGTPYPCP